MGHYDEQYEADARQRREERRKQYAPVIAEFSRHLQALQKLIPHLPGNGQDMLRIKISESEFWLNKIEEELK